MEWVLVENKTLQTGLPPVFRAAILLKRKTDDQFIATFQITAGDGSIQSMLGKSNNLDDPVTFKPGVDMKAREGAYIDAHHLDCDLDQFVEMRATELFQLNSHILDEGAAIQEELLNIAQGREKTSGDTAAKADQLETSFVELWNIGLGVPPEDRKQDSNGSMQTSESGIPPIRQKQWLGSLDQSMVGNFLEWCKELASLYIQMHSKANMAKAGPSKTH